MKLSVVLATRNEEKNIAQCLESVKTIADEIIVVDEESSDKTEEIAERFGAKVIRTKHEPVFHITKQKAIDAATGDWILQLDADERVTGKLSQEIKEVLNMGVEEVKKRKFDPKKEKLFKKHQELIEKRDEKIGQGAGEVVAFFIPRVNYFLGKPLIHAGVYPDGVIRLIKKGKAHFPAKSVHEQMTVDGGIAWLASDLEHHDSPTLGRYFARLNRYTDLHAAELKERKAPKNIFYFFYYSIVLSLFVFLNLFIRHKGFLDGIRGFMWSLFSSWHYPIAYFKYWQMK
jgi:glycosyltransferase involved in cell wall biosynthesis